MADQPVSDVLATRSYKGDASAGGGVYYGVKLDATPFDKLAQYTFYENRDKWERKNKEDDAAALKMADMVALDINSSFPEFYDHLNAKKQELSEMLKDSSVLNYQKNPEGYKKMSALYGEIVADKNKAVANDVKNNAAQAAIALLPEKQQEAAKAVLEIDRKILLAKGADYALKKGSLMTTGQKFEASDYAVPTVGTVEFSASILGYDDNKERSVKVVDANGAWVQAGIAAAQGQKEFVAKPNPDKDPVIDLENQRRKLIFTQNKEMGTNPALEETVKKFDETIKAWDTYNKLSPEQKATTTAVEKPQIVADAEKFNENIQMANRELDRTVGGKRAPNFMEVNLKDGISPQEYVYMQSLSKVGSFIKADEKAIHHGEGSQNARHAETEAGLMKRKRMEMAKPPAGVPGAQDSKGNIIYSINGIYGDPKNRIENGHLFRDGKFDAGFNKDVKVDAGASGAYIQSWYNQYNTLTGKDQVGAKVRLYDDGAGGKKQLNARFRNGVIYAIESDNGGFITVDDFQKISDINGQKKESKVISETEVGVGGGGSGLP